MNKTKAFTLIEILVAVSIIALLMSLALVSYSGSRGQARDAQRKSDLNQYRNALENFASAHEGMYPSRASARMADEVLCEPDDGVGLSPNFISSCPIDPRFYYGTLDPYCYYYETDGTGSGNPDATNYVLWGQLESGDCWTVCSDGQTGILTGDCPAENNLGVCPL